MILRTEAIVLRRIPFSETSLILTLFTREFGKISVIAKGARRIKSKFGATLQPLSYIQIVFYKKEGRDLQNLTDASIVLPFPYLQKSLVKIGIGLQILERTFQLLEADETQPVIFNLLLETLIRLDKTDGAEQNLFVAYSLKLLENLGFKPDINKKDIEALEENGGWFVPENGEILPYGSPEKSAIKATKQALRAFAILAKSDLETAQRLRLAEPTQQEVSQMLELFLQKHVEGYKSSKAAKVMAQISVNSNKIL